ncbi:unnamed protein product [Pleuronectes platessa]|uniref:Uncharacterized protein n=1 Tax=Pleuronectes platessa TaxID=8262 RepID=A0A9N7YAW2_PLEPL|nr:unnamed protein product [Pleuronectes platessa]
MRLGSRWLEKRSAAGSLPPASSVTGLRSGTKAIKAQLKTAARPQVENTRGGDLEHVEWKGGNSTCDRLRLESMGGGMKERSWREDSEKKDEQEAERETTRGTGSKCQKRGSDGRFPSQLPSGSITPPLTGNWTIRYGSF